MNYHPVPARARSLYALWSGGGYAHSTENWVRDHKSLIVTTHRGPLRRLSVAFRSAVSGLSIINAQITETSNQKDVFSFRVRTWNDVLFSNVYVFLRGLSWEAADKLRLCMIVLKSEKLRETDSFPIGTVNAEVVGSCNWTEGGGNFLVIQISQQNKDFCSFLKG